MCVSIFYMYIIYMIFYTLDCLKFVWFCFVAADTLNNKVIFRRNVQWGMSLLRLWIEMNHRICFKGNETFLGEWLLNNVPLDIVQSILASDPWCHGMEMLSAFSKFGHVCWSDPWFKNAAGPGANNCMSYVCYSQCSTLNFVVFSSRRRQVTRFSGRDKLSVGRG